MRPFLIDQLIVNVVFGQGDYSMNKSKLYLALAAALSMQVPTYTFAQEAEETLRRYIETTREVPECD